MIDGGDPHAVHTMARLPLDHVDESARWRVGLLLGQHHITSEWDGTTLVLPEAAVDLVTSHLLLSTPVDAAERESDDLGPDEPEPRDRTVPSPYVRRIIAWWIDAVLVSVATAPVGRLWALVAVWFAYHTIPTALFGRTIGKWLTHLRVTHRGSIPPGWTAAAVRDLVVTLPWLVVLVVPTDAPNVVAIVLWAWNLVVVAPILADPHRRGLHDRLAHTEVILDRRV